MRPSGFALPFRKEKTSAEERSYHGGSPGQELNAQRCEFPLIPLQTISKTDAFSPASPVQHEYTDRVGVPALAGGCRLKPGLQLRTG